VRDDGEHGAGDLDVTCRVRIVAQRGRASVTVSYVSYPNSAETDSVRVIVAMDTAEPPVELDESAAILMVGVLERAAGEAWLSASLRSALDLLDPGAGWISRAGAGSYRENGP
jgi:hypothetical protein